MRILLMVKVKPIMMILRQMFKHNPSIDVFEFELERLNQWDLGVQVA